MSYFPAIDSTIFLRGKLNFVATENAISYNPVCDSRPMVSDGVNPGPKEKSPRKIWTYHLGKCLPKVTKRDSGF